MGSLKKTLHTFITLVTCAATAVQPALAQSIVADGGANAPTVLETANGTDMVMIERPNGAGVSLNTYQQFDVSESGAILNNIQGNFGNTNLGGFVQGNSNLSGGAATLIINQVTAPNPSDLLGYLEVGGAQADVVVANAYGITCNGCGFINTDRAVLTTGALTFNAVGALDTISVTDGTIAIGAGGADARGVSQFDLISRQVNFAGSVQGQRVLVIAGQNDVIFSTGAVSENGGDGSASPEYAIDSTVFGGMYANKITIVSTEAGVGARAPAQMAASTQGMSITADGRLVIGKASSAGDLTARSNNDSVVVRETVVTQEALTLEAKRDLILEADGIIVSEAAASLTAEGDLRLEADAQVAAQTNLTLEAGATLALAENAKALSVGGLGLDAQGITLGNGTVVYAGGNLIGNATETLTNGGQIQSGGLMLLTAGNQITNGGLIDAQSALRLTSASLTNTGVVDATGGALFLGGLSAFDNTGGTLSSDTGIQIELSGTQNLNVANWGTVQSADWLTLQGANGGEMTALNIAADAEILANGQLVVKAQSLVNAGTVASVDGNLLLQASADITNTGLIYAGGDLLALRAGGTVLNDGGVILAASNMLLCGVSSVDCTQNLSGDRAGALINRTRVDGADYVPGFIETLNGDMILAASEIRNERVGSAEVAESAPFDRTSRTVGRDSCSTFACLGDDSDDYYKEWRYKITTSVDLEGPASSIISGRDLTFDAGTIRNDYAMISAANDITFNATEVINAGATSGTTNYRDRQDWYYDDRNVFSGGNRDYAVGPVVTTTTFTADEVFTGVIEAGGTIGGTVVDAVINTSVNGNLANLTAQTSGTTAPTLGDPNDITGNIDLSVLGNDQLFVTNPGGGGFVIETRPEFIDQSQFISSDYFLDTLGFNPDATQIRLGDPFAETYLIRNQIRDLTGRRILDSDLSEKEQIRLMYDNAVDAAADLGLRPGVALTPEQIAALTTDIVWLEEQMISGQLVLVPRVYLGASGGASGFNPALITGKNVAFNVGSFTNSGAINAFDSLVINAASDIRNLGGSMTAFDLLQLTSAQGDLLNLSGTITGGDVTIIANNIISETDVIRFVDGENVQEIAAPSALITATSGVLTLDASGDITVISGDLSGQSGVNILAGGDIDFAALELNSSYDGAGEDWSFTQITSLADVSTITSTNGGASIVSAQVSDQGGIVGGGNILFEGTQITAQDAVDVTAVAGSVIIAAATDTTYSDLWTQSETLVSSYELRDERLTVRNETASISGSEINIYAAGTVFDQSSDLVTTAGDLTIESASGDVLFGSVTDIDARNTFENKTAFGGLFEFEDESQSLLATALSTQANAQGDIDIIAGRDLEFQGGNFTATGAINTDVGGETRILATVDTDFSYVKSLDNDSLLVVNTTTVDLEQTAGFTQLTAGNGVNFDETSPITVGLVATQAAVGASAMGLVGVSDVSDPTQDMAITDFFLPDATGSPEDRLAALTQDQLGGALSGLQNENDGAAEADSGGDTNPAFDFENSMVSVDLPTAVDGAGYAYLDQLSEDENLTVQEMALIQHSYLDEQVALGTIGQLAVNYVAAVATAGMSGIAQVVASSALSSTIEGVVTGNIDIEAMITKAAFAGVSSFATSSFNLDQLAGLGDSTATSLIGGSAGNFSVNGIVNQFGDSIVSAGLTTAVYGGDFSDNFGSSFQGGLISLGTADLQTMIGDQYNHTDDAGNPVGPGEGSLGHVLTHAVVGCVSVAVQDGNCGAGAFAAGTTAVYAGVLDGRSSEAGRDATETNILNANAELMGGLTAAFSGADAEDVLQAAGVGASGFRNNYLTHAQAEAMRNALLSCGSENTECLRGIAASYLNLSAENTENLLMCGSDTACIDALSGDIVDARSVFAEMRDLGASGAFGNEPQFESTMGDLFGLQNLDDRFAGLQGNPFNTWQDDFPEFHELNCQGLNAANCLLAYGNHRNGQALLEGLTAGAEAVFGSTGVGGMIMGVYECGNNVSVLGCGLAATEVLGGAGELLEAGTRIMIRIDGDVVEVVADGAGGFRGTDDVPIGTANNGGDGPYDPIQTRTDLEEMYGADNVTSTTVPPATLRGEPGSATIVQHNGQNVRITFDQRGYPVFDDVAAFDTRVDFTDVSGSNYSGSMRAATRDLRDGINSGRVDSSQFTSEQLGAIQGGRETIPDFTWHHHQETGRMQLVPREIHGCVGHVGGNAMCQGR